MLRILEKTLDKILWALGTLSIILIVLLSLFIAVQVICRSILNVNVAGLFDLAIYSLIVFPFLTAAYTLSRGKHVSVDILTARLPDESKALLNIAIGLLSMAFVSVLGWESGYWANRLLRSGVTTIAAIPLPKGVLVSTITIGCIFLVLQLLRMMASDIGFLLKYYASKKKTESKWFYSPWLWFFCFVIGISFGIVLFLSGHPIAGLIIIATVCLFSGMPVFFSLGVIGCIGLTLLTGTNTLIQLPITAYRAMDSFPLTCLPLFILGGMIMHSGKIVDDLFSFFEIVMGGFAPSLLIATMAVGGIFCAISGSSVGATAVVAGLALPILMKRGYRITISCGAIAGSTVGTLIPPSIGYVIYGVITEESIAQLFMAAVGPAIVLFVLYFSYVIILGIVDRRLLLEGGRRLDETPRDSIGWRQFFVSLRKAIWGLLAPVLVLGGIYWGVFTPTEAAAVLVVYAVLICVFVTKTLSFRELINTAARNAEISSMLLCIIFSAYIFALVISQLQIAAGMVAFAEKGGMGATTTLCLIFGILFIFGMFLDAASIKVITLPVFYPMAMAVGINSLWLGVFYQIILEIGLLTPPVGMNLFTIRGVSGIPLIKIIAGTLPFLLMMFLTILIIYFFPEIVTWLPKAMAPSM